MLASSIIAQNSYYPITLDPHLGYRSPTCHLGPALGTTDIVTRRAQLVGGLVTAVGADAVASGPSTGLGAAHPTPSAATCAPSTSGPSPATE